MIGKIQIYIYFHDGLLYNLIITNVYKYKTWKT